MRRNVDARDKPGHDAAGVASDKADFKDGMTANRTGTPVYAASVKKGPPPYRSSGKSSMRNSAGARSLSLAKAASR